MRVHVGETPFKMFSEAAESWDEVVSYTIPCPSGFRAAVLELVERSGVDIAFLINAALNIVHPDTHHQVADPGEPAADDMLSVEEPVRFGGRRTSRCSPVLVVRFRRGWKVSTLRHALAVALTISNPILLRQVQRIETERLEQANELLERQLAECRAALERLSFQPLPSGIKNQREAAHIMGFASAIGLDLETINARFRVLALIYHPDQGVLGSSERMGQLIDARNILRRMFRTAG
ncbi:MAG: hypothetical protein WCK65_07240 [Rhodospirillaceae bacterium]